MYQYKGLACTLTIDSRDRSRDQSCSSEHNIYAIQINFPRASHRRLNGNNHEITFPSVDSISEQLDHTIYFMNISIIITYQFLFVD